MRKAIAIEFEVEGPTSEDIENFALSWAWLGEYTVNDETAQTVCVIDTKTIYIRGIDNVDDS